MSSFTSSFFMMSFAKNYQNWPMFHTVLQKIKVALFIETRCICTLGDFTFRLRLLLSLNFGLSTYLSQKVK